MYDLIIIGSGPAGLGAAVYGKRAGFFYPGIGTGAHERRADFKYL